MQKGLDKAVDVTIQDAIGAKDIPAFDMNAGCTGFVYGLSIASQFIENGKSQVAVVVGAEDSLAEVAEKLAARRFTVFVQYSDQVRAQRGGVTAEPTDLDGRILYQSLSSSRLLGWDADDSRLVNAPAGREPANDDRCRLRANVTSHADDDRMDLCKIFRFSGL